MAVVRHVALVCRVDRSLEQLDINGNYLVRTEMAGLMAVGLADEGFGLTACIRLDDREMVVSGVEFYTNGDIGRIFLQSLGRFVSQRVITLPGDQMTDEKFSDYVQRRWKLLWYRANGPEIPPELP